MAKCNRCGKHGLFFRVTANGYCFECDRIIRLESEELQLQEATRKLKADIQTMQESFDQLKANRDSLYHDIESQARENALRQIADQIDAQKEKLQLVVNQVADTQHNLESLSEQVTQSEKSVILNSNKVRRIQTLLKSMQYSATKYFNEEGFSREIVSDESITEAEELLSTTVKLKLHLMDIRELRKLYNQNNKVIQELLIKYQDRYTTKANTTIYRLMIIALEAELQNVLGVFQTS